MDDFHHIFFVSVDKYLYLCTTIDFASGTKGAPGDPPIEKYKVQLEDWRNLDVNPLTKNLRVQIQNTNRFHTEIYADSYLDKIKENGGELKLTDSAPTRLTRERNP